MVEAGKVEADECESIVKAILKREELGSTGIGRGVAVPHTKHPSVDRLVGTVAVSAAGVDFASLDGEAVHLFFLLISPPDRTGDHLRALEELPRQLRDDTFCRFLKQKVSSRKAAARCFPDPQEVVAGPIRQRNREEKQVDGLAGGAGQSTPAAIDRHRAHQAIDAVLGVGKLSHS